MNTKVTRICAAVALAGAALGTTMNASAGCLSPGLKPTADIVPGVGELLQTNGDSFVSIVGMWHAQLLIDGNVIDDGWQTWHSDGTEIMNSSRSPTTQSWCSGVWKQVGRSTYRLRHFAMSWFDAQNAEGPLELHETVTIDRTGNHFTGSFTLDQYETGEPGTVESGTPIHVTGSVVGVRICIT